MAGFFIAYRIGETMTTKICSKCAVEKGIEEFPTRFYPSRGKRYTSNHCAGCEQERARLKSLRRSKKNRQEERRQHSEKVGKTYRTWDEVQTSKKEKLQLLDAKKEAIKAWEDWVLVLAPDQWLDSFYHATGKPWLDHRISVADRYRVRYRTDNAFHQNEKARSQAFKHDHPEYAPRWANGNQRVLQQHDGTMKKGVAILLLNELQTCPYCGCDLTMDNRVLDHMDPLSLDGVHGVSNLIVCCATCNKEKYTTPFFQWLKELHPHNKKIALDFYNYKKQYVEAA